MKINRYKVPIHLGYEEKGGKRGQLQGYSLVHASCPDSARINAIKQTKRNLAKRGMIVKSIGADQPEEMAYA